MVEIRRLEAEEGRRRVRELAGVLKDCVDGGASVSFMASLTQEEAVAFFEGSVAEVEKGERILLAAFADSELVGTVQVLLASPPNQPHRGDLAKMLVARRARRLGIGRMLLERAEEEARLAGKTLLVLDTVTGDNAERLYLRHGWTISGVIPNYALYPDGRYCDTTVFWKQIAPLG